MNEKTIWRPLLGAVALSALLLAIGLLLHPTLAASPLQDTSPELTITKIAAGDGTIGPGQTLQFTLVVTNTGTVTATNVTVQDDYDQSALSTIKIISDVEQDLGEARNDGDLIIWEVGDLAPGAVWSASYEATAAEAFESGVSEISNQAIAQVEGVQVAQDEVVLTVRAPQLSLSRDRQCLDGEGEGEVVPGATLRYIIRYSNNGTADATNVTLVDTFDDTVLQQVGNITEGGHRDGATVRWNLGTIPAQASGEVSYEFTLKPALARGAIEVLNQATMTADDVEPVTASDSFVLRTPMLVVERQREDLNGRPIEPGDTLRFTIRVRNTGPVEASSVMVRDDFDERVVAEVSNISTGGGEADGSIEWELTEPLAEGAEQTFSYEVSLKSEIAESTEAANTAIISIGTTEVARRQTTMTIEPKETASDTRDGPRIFEEDPHTLSWLVGVMSSIALTAVAGTALAGPSIMEDWNARYMRVVVEGIAVIVIVGAVLILAMGSGIQQDGAVSILSGIAGYVLGRSVGEK